MRFGNSNQRKIEFIVNGHKKWKWKTLEARTETAGAEHVAAISIRSRQWMVSGDASWSERVMLMEIKFILSINFMPLPSHFISIEMTLSASVLGTHTQHCRHHHDGRRTQTAKFVFQITKNAFSLSFFIFAPFGCDFGRIDSMASYANALVLRMWVERNEMTNLIIKSVFTSTQHKIESHVERTIFSLSISPISIEFIFAMAETPNAPGIMHSQNERMSCTSSECGIAGHVCHVIPTFTQNPDVGRSLIWAQVNLPVIFNSDFIEREKSAIRLSSFALAAISHQRNCAHYSQSLACVLRIGPQQKWVSDICTAIPCLAKYRMKELASFQLHYWVVVIGCAHLVHVRPITRHEKMYAKRKSKRKASNVQQTFDAITFYRHFLHRDFSFCQRKCVAYTTSTPPPTSILVKTNVLYIIFHLIVRARHDYDCRHYNSVFCFNFCHCYCSRQRLLQSSFLAVSWFIFLRVEGRQKKALSLSLQMSLKYHDGGCVPPYIEQYAAAQPNNEPVNAFYHHEFLFFRRLCVFRSLLLLYWRLNCLFFCDCFFAAFTIRLLPLFLSLKPILTSQRLPFDAIQLLCHVKIRISRQIDIGMMSWNVCQWKLKVTSTEIQLDTRIELNMLAARI